MKLECLLTQLLAEDAVVKITGSAEQEVTGIVYDTRKTIEKGNAFVCIAGAVFDGHSYAETAVAAGASVIVAEQELSLPETVTV